MDWVGSLGNCGSIRKAADFHKAIILDYGILYNSFPSNLLNKSKTQTSDDI
jgi:hypothetical protein